jgi:5-oxoprolinase (ATP-hydrolysing)
MDHTGVAAARADLAREVAKLDGLEGSTADGSLVVDTFLDCRYAGQSHELTVREVDEFAGEHARRNGYARPGVPVEIVALRARARGAAPLDPAELPAPARARVVGPDVASEPDCTVWIPEGWTADPHPTGAWILTRSDA